MIPNEMVDDHVNLEPVNKPNAKNKNGKNENKKNEGQDQQQTNWAASKIREKGKGAKGDP